MEMSRGSKFYENEKKREVKTQKRVAGWLPLELLCLATNVPLLVSSLSFPSLEVYDDDDDDD